jgi:DNA-binding response OmpR family regulator
MGYGMHCLIVEDDPQLAFMLSENLQDIGCETSTEYTVKDAISALRCRKFDIILLDHHLPDGTSNDIAMLAATTQPNCRIILLTGGAIYPRGEHADMAPGVDWLMRKPVSLKDLNALVTYAGMDRHWHPTTV